jgi:hypothetical protein
MLAALHGRHAFLMRWAGGFAEYIPVLIIQASSRTSSMLRRCRQGSILALKRQPLAELAEVSVAQVLELNCCSLALQFAHADGTVFQFYERPGVPCPTEQTAAKLADST